MIINSFKGTCRFLSNFWPVIIIDNGKAYPSVEHAYQAAKTLDSILQEMIRTCSTAAEAKRIGKSVPLRPDWEEVKISFMHYFVWYKFSMNLELKRLLLATNPAVLVEGNTWGDRFWGVCRGVGENRLGKILMNVRKMLIDEATTH